MLGAIDQGTINQQQLERFTRTWVTAPLARVSVEVSVIAERLRENRRSDLSAFAAICALRASRSQESKDSDFFAGLAKQLHASYGLGLLDYYQDAIGDPRALLGSVSPSMPLISYPIACLRLIETWGILALQPELPEQRRRACSEAVARLISNQPGVARPPSGRWAHSVLIGVLGCWAADDSTAELYLERVFVWLLDRNEHDWGLPSSDASEYEEIEWLLGPPLMHVEKRRHGLSYLAAVLLDLCVVRRYSRLYNDGLSDLHALGIIPTLFVADESLARWGAGEFGLRSITNARYAADWQTGPPYAQHHLIAGESGDPWEALALTTIPRNRHPFWAVESLASRGGGRSGAPNGGT